MRVAKELGEAENNHLDLYERLDELQRKNPGLVEYRDLISDFHEATTQVLAYCYSAMRAATSELDLPEIADQIGARLKRIRQLECKLRQTT